MPFIVSVSLGVRFLFNVVDFECDGSVIDAATLG